MLQARLFSYPDTHRHRIGPNYLQLPVNQPKVPVSNYGRGGSMRYTIDEPGPTYEPNSLNGPQEDPSLKEDAYGYEISGRAARWNHRDVDEDYYSQAGILFRDVMTEEERERLIDNLVDHMRVVPSEIQLRQIRHFFLADPTYGEGVARGLGLDVREAMGTPVTP
jgi:catalase